MLDKFAKKPAKKSGRPEDRKAFDYSLFRRRWGGILGLERCKKGKISLKSAFFEMRIDVAGVFIA
jgi:hypothetical protein